MEENGGGPGQRKMQKSQQAVLGKSESGGRTSAIDWFIRSLGKTGKAKVLTIKIGHAGSSKLSTKFQRTRHRPSHQHRGPEAGGSLRNRRTEDESQAPRNSN